MMTPRPNRWRMRVFVVFLAAIGVVWWSIRQRPPNLLSVENRSAQTIARLRVTRGEEVSKFDDVVTGAAVTTPFHIKSAERFTLEGQLADGTLLRGQFTGDASEEAIRLTVLPGGQIQFRQGDKSGPR